MRAALTEPIFGSTKRMSHSRGPQRADGSGTRLVHEDAGASDETPAWSHDGSTIAFVKRVGADATIETMRPNGSRVRALTKDETACNSCVAACCLSAYRRAGD
jgi:Tol biopolymer transport system component